MQKKEILEGSEEWDVLHRKYYQEELRRLGIGAPAGCMPDIIRITVTYDGSLVNFHSRDSTISADGRYVAFDSQATNILPGSSVCGGINSCAFVRDTCIGVRTRCVPATFAVSLDAQGGICAY